VEPSGDPTKAMFTQSFTAVTAPCFSLNAIGAAPAADPEATVVAYGPPPGQVTSVYPGPAPPPPPPPSPASRC